MFIIDKPYVSDFLKETLRAHEIPVIRTESAAELLQTHGIRLMDESDAVNKNKKNPSPKIYTNSENAIAWIHDHLYFTGLPAMIDTFKDKYKFRELISPLFPDFYFRKTDLDGLVKLDISDIPLPFIIKPSIGFFSLGVHKVTKTAEWPGVISTIISKVNSVKIYPDQVLNTASWIIEQVIEGEEYAVDAYFDAQGEPVILGIFRHAFASESDVNDRVYTTSKEIIGKNIGEFSDFLARLSALTPLKNFPVHVELRRSENGILMPIEVNPMRFGGWCTTADLTCLAFGLNPYSAYYLDNKPDWSELLKNKTGQQFSIIVLDNSTGMDIQRITEFNYEALISHFTNIIELRKIDHKQHHVFGFIFLKTDNENRSELDYILKSDLTEFISTE
jgi:hypothetical protein